MKIDLLAFDAVKFAYQADADAAGELVLIDSTQLTIPDRSGLVMYLGNCWVESNGTHANNDISRAMNVCIKSFSICEHIPAFVIRVDGKNCFYNILFRQWLPIEN